MLAQRVSGESRQFLLEDIAVATGGSVISRLSVDLDSVSLSELGRAKHVEVTKDGCWITGGAGSPSAIESRAAGIRQQISVGSGDYDVERLRERLANLVGRVIAIKIGGVSSLDRAERAYKMRSALHSARDALSFGVVLGGGLSLYRAGQELRPSSEAAKIVRAALMEPLRQQIANARQNERDLLPKIEAARPYSVGFDAESREVVDLEKSGILDSAGLCVSAIQLAFAHARAILQTGVWDLTERSSSQLPQVTHRFSENT